MTKQDLEQIRRYMLEKGIKDTELKAANALDGTEIWGAVQEGKSVKISTQSILNFLKPILDPNLSMFLGFYQSEEDLKGFYPTAKDGSYAWVLSPEFPDYPGEVYVYAATTGWVGTGVKASDDTKVDLKDYIESIEVDEIAKLPDYTASRAISDGSGNNIEETYLRRDEVIDGTVKGDKGDDGDSWFIVATGYVADVDSEDPVTRYQLCRIIGSTYITLQEGGYWQVSGISQSIVNKKILVSSGYALDYSFSAARYPEYTRFLIEVFDTDDFTNVIAACPLSVMHGGKKGGGKVIVSVTEPTEKEEGTIWIKESPLVVRATPTSLGWRLYAVCLDIVGSNDFDISHLLPNGTRIPCDPVIAKQDLLAKSSKVYAGISAISSSIVGEAQTILRISPNKYSPDGDCVYIPLDRTKGADVGLGPMILPYWVQSKISGGSFVLASSEDLSTSTVTVTGDSGISASITPSNRTISVIVDPISTGSKYAEIAIKNANGTTIVPVIQR